MILPSLYFLWPLWNNNGWYICDVCNFQSTADFFWRLFFTCYQNMSSLYLWLSFHNDEKLKMNLHSGIVTRKGTLVTMILASVFQNKLCVGCTRDCFIQLPISMAWGRGAQKLLIWGVVEKYWKFNLFKIAKKSTSLQH